MKTEAVRNLTPRQRDCLRCVAELKKTEQIAAELGISPSTVNTHIERAIALLGASSRREAALAVLAYEGAGRQKTPTETSRLAEAPPPASSPPDLATAIGRRRNDLTWPQRILVAILALAILCIAIAGLGAAIEQLSSWRASLAH